MKIQTIYFMDQDTPEQKKQKEQQQKDYFAAGYRKIGVTGKMFGFVIHYGKEKANQVRIQ